MGLFDRLLGKAPASRPPQPPAAPVSERPEPQASPSPAPSGPVAVVPRLEAARERLDAKDLPGAVAIYEEVLAVAGDRADVLVRISGDLGSTGYILPIVELVAPRYDADRHGPAIGLNLLQAYLALRNPEAAQHVLDILFSLNRPDLEERLHGFSNAIAELMAQGAVAGLPGATTPGAGGAQPGPAKIALVSISKPIWYYGLESMAEVLLPSGGRPRRIAFAQLALPGRFPTPEAAAEASGKPETELARLSRALPLWFTEAFFYCPHYAPITAIGSMDGPDARKELVVFPQEWTTDNLRQLVDTTEGGLDYIVTGALTETNGDFEVILRIWEVRKFRERKQLGATWTPATADQELAGLLSKLKAFMEWEPFPAGQTIAYAEPASARAWLDVLGYSLNLFLASKRLLASDLLPEAAPLMDQASLLAGRSPVGSLAWLTLEARARDLGIQPAAAPSALDPSPLVSRARQALLGGAGA